MALDLLSMLIEGEQREVYEMNIIYIAFSCSPYHGSEDKIGWSIPLESAKKNNVFVITREEQRQYVDRWLSEHEQSNLAFYYVSLSERQERLLSHFPYAARYNLYHKLAFKLAKEICATENIQIIHQITPVEFRCIGNYGAIQGAKFVCGPLGGGEWIPYGLKRYARGKMHVELVRGAASWIYRYKYRLTKELSKWDYTMFANEETRDYLFGGRCRSYPHSVYSEIGLSASELGSSVTQGGNSRCVFLVAGRLVYRKGHRFLLDALRKIPENYDYECRIVGDGPEREKLQEICSQDTCLARHVVFVGRIPYDRMEAEYNNADVLIMPSIRETTGTVLLEAISRGLPVITINRFGGAVLLDQSMGWLYEGCCYDDYVENLKKAMVCCITQPEEVIQRGRNARARAENYTWEEKMKVYQAVYESVIRDRSELI